MSDAAKGPSRFASWIVFVAVLGAIGLCIGASGLALASMNYDQRYTGRIYPGISIYGVDLGGLTVDEAAAALRSGLPDPATLPLTLRTGDHTWSRTWAHLGLRFDPIATARLAYQVGRERVLEQRYIAQLRARIGGCVLSPVVVLPTPPQAAASLRALASDVVVPPVNASLIIEPDGVTPVPAQAGLEPDVQEIVAVLQHALGFGSEGLVLEILTRQVEPPIANPGPVQTQAEALLARPFTLTGEDKLTGFSGAWEVVPAAVAEWLVAQEIEDESGARLVLAVRKEAIRATLHDLNSQLSDDIAIDVERTLPSVRTAIEDGESQTTAILIHPPRNYVVQSGDTLMSIARAHGYPAWRLVEANPDIDSRRFQPGQEIVIPSVDVLLPLPPILDRRIVIDISDQRLYAYAGGMLVFDFIASTGIASSPTITGTFQVLGKEEEAYASSWDLWMPHFIGIYESGPDFTNGIHGLPTLSSGARLWDGYLGRPVSYGCIVIGLNDAAALYEWAEVGTLVLVRG